MNFKVLKQKYQNKSIEDNGAYMSKEANSFARHIKAYLTGIAFENNFKLVDFQIGHYYIFGFFEKDGKYVYFSRELERYEKPINLEQNHDILIRTAEHIKDYRGGVNNYTSFKNIGVDVLRLFNL